MTRIAKRVATATFLAALVAGTVPAAAETARVWTSGKDDGDVVRRIVVSKGSGSFLGVGVADVDAERAKSLGLREPQGVEVTSVVEGSGADKAGVKKGDVILEYNGERIEGTAQFVRMVRETPADRSVRLAVSRGGQTQTLTATIGKREPSIYRFHGEDGEEVDLDELPHWTGEGMPPEALAELEKLKDLQIEIPEIVLPEIPSVMMAYRSPRLGVESETLGPQLAEFFGVKEGVLVRSVVKDSAAEKAGIKAGDVITKVGDESVERPGDITSALRSSKAGDDVPVTVVRSGKERVISVKVEKASEGSGPALAPRHYREKKVIRIPSESNEL